MTENPSLIYYFLNASWVVKMVMLLLFAASIFSWAYIVERYFYLKRVKAATQEFERAFWSGEDLALLYQATPQEKLLGLSTIFHAGFKEFLRFRKQVGLNAEHILHNTQRAMRVACMREQANLEHHLSFLAVVSSTSPYVGLFGTVFGIMQSLLALSNVQQASIAMVAPGMAEALIATALGLFAAIPAVIAYNRFVAEINSLLNRFDGFQEEFSNILNRQSQAQHKTTPAMESLT